MQLIKAAVVLVSPLLLPSPPLLLSATPPRCTPRAVVTSTGTDSAATNELSARATSVTRKWIKDFVIRLGLCPYAAEAFNTDGQIRYATSFATDEEELVSDFFNEAALLLDTPAKECATTMLTAPRYEGGIEEFYALYEWLADLLEDDDEPILGNQVQPAFFHPDWTFAGLEAQAAVHFEKRSPYPVINLLRRATLDQVVQAGLDRGVIVNKQIAEHNAASLEREGFAALEECFRELHDRPRRS